MFLFAIFLEQEIVHLDSCLPMKSSLGLFAVFLMVDLSIVSTKYLLVELGAENQLEG